MSVHPLLERRVEGEGGEHVWETVLGPESLPYMRDHAVHEWPLMPGTAYLEMPLAGAAEVLGDGPHAIESVVFEQAMFLPEDGTMRVRLTIAPDGEGGAAYRVLSAAGDDELTPNARGRISAEPDRGQVPAASIEEIRARCTEERTGEEHYELTRSYGAYYGPAFQGLKHVWRHDGEAIGRAVAPPELEADIDSYGLHPAMLDACLQALLSCLDEGQDRWRMYLPVGVDAYRLRRKPSRELWSHAIGHPPEDPEARTRVGDVRVLDDEGELVCEILGVRCEGSGRKRKSRK